MIDVVVFLLVIDNDLSAVNQIVYFSKKNSLATTYTKNNYVGVTETVMNLTAICVVELSGTKVQVKSTFCLSACNDLMSYIQTEIPVDGK